MDQLMVDLTGLGGAAEGDAVTLIGPSGDDIITAGEVGTWAGTISYDVLSGIGVRVPRAFTSARAAPSPSVAQ